MIPVQLRKAVKYIHSRSTLKPRIGIILGSGLGTLVDVVENKVKISTSRIPYYPVSTVSGHEGYIALGTLQGIPLFIVQGRTHYYEGYSAEKITFVVRIMVEFGIKILIVTNAAGAVNARLNPGDLMLITDHINNMFTNPLFGQIKYGGPRFPDMSDPYSSKYFNLIEEIAMANKVVLKRGVLYVSSGPSYETAAEVRMINKLGADAASMSTVPEVLVARQAGLEVIGISCITNRGTGVSSKKLSHGEVTRIANKVKSKFLRLMKGIIIQINRYYIIT
jgi:purine-nucleoside phosphorylase